MTIKKELRLLTDLEDIKGAIKVRKSKDSITQTRQQYCIDETTVLNVSIFLLD